MSRDEAIETLEALAHGADPWTGETLPEASPYNNPRVLRALFVAVRELESRAGASAMRERKRTRSGEPWAAEEECELAREFDEGIEIEKLAQRHERTPGSIEARLMRLGKLAPADARFFALVRG